MKCLDGYANERSWYADAARLYSTSKCFRSYCARRSKVCMRIFASMLASNTRVIANSIPQIQLVTEGRTFCLAPDDPQQIDFWFEAIRTALAPYLL
jgi:hypothetical protein